MEWLADPATWSALVTLTVLEIVLGVDNIVFISILVGRLPEHQRAQGRLIGLSLAMGMRIVLLLSLSFIMGLTAPLVTVADAEISGRDLILLGGGLFLLWKAVHEIHSSLEGVGKSQPAPVQATLGAVLAQIAMIDLVFSLDSVITAIGMSDEIWIMITAVVLAVLVMMFSAQAIGDFVDQHPTVKILALAFLLMVGVALIAEGLDVHIPKGYIYFAMAFSVGVEMLNLRARKVAEDRASRVPKPPVRLHKRGPAVSE